MAGQVRYLLSRDGRYYARLVVPKDLRPYLERKTELRTPLGPDKREAMRLLSGAVAVLQERIALAEAKAARVKDAPVAERARYPMRPEALAQAHYQRQIANDESLRNHPVFSAYVGVSIDDGEVAQLRAGIAGGLSDEALEAVIGAELERFRRLGNVDAPKGSHEWRAAARALCGAQLEFLALMVERDEGTFTGTPSDPMLAQVEEVAPALPPVSLKGLFADYVKARVAVGRGRSIEGRYAPVIARLRKHLKHDDAQQITKTDLLAWRDKLAETLAPRTVGTVYLAAVHAMLQWAKDEDRLPENAAAGVKVAQVKTRRTREKGYTDDEAKALLRGAKAYVPKVGPTAHTTERTHLTRAKRWVPWLCAFTGTRVGEITQLRGQDFRQEAGRWVVRITPEAGTTKSGNYRDVPLHPQLVELGLLDVVKDAGAGPLFYKDTAGRDPIKAARMVSSKLALWIRSLGIAPEGVAPSHGWRHRFKTVAIELGVHKRVIDAMQDHAGETAGDDYGDVTLAAKRKAVEAFPQYVIS